MAKGFLAVVVGGWLQTIALLRKLRHRGTLKVDWIFAFVCAAYKPGAHADLMPSAIPTWSGGNQPGFIMAYIESNEAPDDI